MRKSQKSRRAAELLCWELTKMEVLMRDDFRCQYKGHNCQQIAVDISHVLTKGAHPALKFDPDNLLAACRPCHTEYEGGSERHRNILRDNYPERWARIEEQLHNGK